MAPMSHVWAKFFAGFAASATLVHMWLAFWGRDVLPIRIGRFVFSSDWNMTLMKMWLLVLAMLLCFGWSRSRAGARRSARPADRDMASIWARARSRPHNGLTHELTVRRSQTDGKLEVCDE